MFLSSSSCQRRRALKRTVGGATTLCIVGRRGVECYTSKVRHVLPPGYTVITLKPVPVLDSKRHPVLRNERQKSLLPYWLAQCRPTLPFPEIARNHSFCLSHSTHSPDIPRTASATYSPRHLRVQERRTKQKHHSPH